MEDPELNAMQSILKTLNDLEENSRSRVLAWVADRLEIQSPQMGSISQTDQNGSSADQDEQDFKTFADLYNCASPITNPDKALVAGYWLQKCQGYEEFPSQLANKDLQNLGHALINVTDAFNKLKNKKPALAIQVKKSGKSQQARKQYKLTQAGIDAVNGMLKDNSN